MRGDYDCKDGFEFIMDQQKEVGSCAGIAYVGYKGVVFERCKNRESCILFKNFTKNNLKEYGVPNRVNKLPIKRFRKCNIWKIEEN